MWKIVTNDHLKIDQKQISVERRQQQQLEMVVQALSSSELEMK